MSQAELDAAIRHVFSNPPMMAGEDRANYEILKRLILRELNPQGVHEMLLARDIVDAQWELCRLRGLGPGILHAAIPRVVKSQVAEAGDGATLDARLVPTIRQHVIDMLAGIARAKDELETLLLDHRLSVSMIVAAAFADTIGPQPHTDRMVARACERRDAAYAELERLRARGRRSSTPPAEPPTDDILYGAEAHDITRYQFNGR